MTQYLTKFVQLLVGLNKFAKESKRVDPQVQKYLLQNKL
jgi:hypothetical protein